jgi:hypothetical protein
MIAPKSSAAVNRPPAPRTRARGVIIAVVLLLAGGLDLAGRYWWARRPVSPVSPDYSQAAQTIEDLESGRVLSEKHCGPTTTARFDHRAWQRLTESQRRGLMLTISRVCSGRDQANPVTLYDDRTGDMLADFDGRHIVSRRP